MYVPHEPYEQAVTALGDIPVWRYTGLDELMGLLLERRLWLSCIATMEDQEEGLYFSDPTHDQQLRMIASRMRFGCFVSCWSAQSDESLALWKSYTDDKGIVIKSDIASIRESLDPLDGDIVCMGRVEYRAKPPDLTTLRANSLSFTDALFFKNDAFAYENETRVVFSEFRGNKLPTVENLNSKPIQRSSGVKVDVGRLVHEIRVSPFAPPWFRDLVEKIMVHHGLGNTRVSCSELRPSFEGTANLVEIPAFSHGLVVQGQGTATGHG